MKTNKCISAKGLTTAINRHQKQAKIILLSPLKHTDSIEEKTRIPIQRCREILCVNGLEYTDDELHQVRNFLYQLASIADTQIRHTAQPSIIIPLTHNQIIQNEASHYLRTG